jgi:muramoyltetrapeptide carboxypeptidase
MLQAPFLKAGDKIAITCPAKSLIKPMDDAIKLLSSWGLNVILGDTVHAKFHQFAGNDELRAQDFQRFIDDQDVKAIIAARGGYGSVRIIDQIDFSPLLTHPKWIIGFSDITVFHLHLQKMGLQSIHAQMPATIPDSTALGLESLRKALFGETLQYEIPAHPLNIQGTCHGEIIGGNLSILISLLGSKSDIDYRDKILFIEDVGEYLYAIDRMIRALDRAGKLAHLKGLVVGGFTELKDNDIPFGFSVEEIILEVVSKYHYPVVFNFPAGHIKDNCALRLGGEVSINSSSHTHIKF